MVNWGRFSWASVRYLELRRATLDGREKGRGAAEGTGSWVVQDDSRNCLLHLVLESLAANAVQSMGTESAQISNSFLPRTWVAFGCYRK